MSSSQFDAKTLGIGQLITQRKLFRVPPHQRSFAWEQEAIASFLEDVGQAHNERDSDYFIGLVVVQGPKDGEWVLLDGQQRLTTASLMFAAIRYWLATNGFEDDAKQIDHEYLGVRRLGGEYSSRMLLNQENQDAFVRCVVSLSTTEELRAFAKVLGKRDSNRLLYEAAIDCRKWVASIAEKDKNSPNSLYTLAQFLDARVKVVCVDVSSEVDAYVLFESLNDRGVELSALDLIKNYIVSKGGADEDRWSELSSLLDDFNPDDFLKVFWTNRYGTTQKAQIFRRVKEFYPDSGSVKELMSELIQDANLLVAIEDDSHPYWEGSRKGLRDQTYLLRCLSAKQARPVLISVFRNLDHQLAESVLWQLIVAIVRFQVVGKGRTGVVEKVFGRLCQAISRGDVVSHHESGEILKQLIVSDSEFTDAMRSHADSKFIRISYLLAEYQLRSDPSRAGSGERASRVRDLMERSSLQRVRNSDDDGEPIRDQVEYQLLGNFALVVDDSYLPGDTASLVFERDDILARADQIAHSAPGVWSV